MNERQDNIAPLGVRYTGLAGGMKYDAEKRRLTFTLVTNDRAHLWQDFMIEWNPEDGVGEVHILRNDLQEEPYWEAANPDPHFMPEPTNGTTEEIEKLLPQAEWIHKHLIF